MAANATIVNSEVLFTSDKLPVEVTGMQAIASKMWMPFIGMGFMLVVVAFIIGLFVSGAAADYFSFSKSVREAAGTGSDLATKVWLSTLKFLGLGMILGGVTFLLATILGALRTGGGRVQEALGVDVKIIKPPMTAQLFPMAMMMGMMLLIASFIIGIVLATLSYDYWNHSIATQLNPSTSNLLADLGTINAVKLWLEPFKFVGMALLLTGIGLALATIVRVLRWQSTRLWDILK